jgi:hypothetical protein
MPAAVPIVLAAGTAFAAKKGADASKSAAKGQARSADAGIAEQQRQFDESLRLQAPQRFVGNAATNELARLLGLPQFNETSDNFNRGLDANGNSLTRLTGDAELPVAGQRIVPRAGSNGTFDVFYGDTDVGDLVRGGRNGRFIANGAAIPQPVAPTMMAPAAADSQGVNALSAFLQSPDYQFRRGEGTRDIQSQFAARGGAQSGNALRALSEFSSNLASGEFGNRFNRLASLAGFAQQANSQGAQNAINTGRGVAAGLQDAGNARASGVAGSNQAFQDGISGLAGTIPLFVDAFGRRKNALAGFGGFAGQAGAAGVS